MSADYSLLLVSNNYSRVNLHDGTGKSVANSVAGSLPCDALLQANGETPKQIAAHQSGQSLNSQPATTIYGSGLGADASPRVIELQAKFIF